MAKLATLIDDFQDGVINSSLWNATAGVVETGGRVVITPSASSPQLSADITTYDMVASHIVAHVPVVPPTGTTGTLTAAMVIEAGSPSNAAGIVKYAGDILAVKTVDDITTTVATFTWNPAFLYWRMREASNIFYWEVSSTGTAGSWTSLFNTTVSTNLFPVNSVGAYFYAEYTGFEASPGTFALESVNLGHQITASGSSTSTGTAALTIRTTHQITAAAASSTTGTAALLLRYRITGSAASTSSGSAAITIPPLGSHAITASGASTSTGTASFIILTPGQMTATGISYSSGSVSLRVNYQLTAVGQSYSTGTAAFVVVTPAPDSTITQYFIFEPPVVYDLPPTLPNPRPRYINAHARWKGGQRRGRSVLRHGTTITVVDTPTVDQMAAADYVYQGGHVYTISNLEADVLAAAGLTVTPITYAITLYPALDIFPSTTLYPGYQDLPL